LFCFDFNLLIHSEKYLTMSIFSYLRQGGVNVRKRKENKVQQQWKLPGPDNSKGGANNDVEISHKTPDIQRFLDYTASPHLNS
jgi:hypothetical protein